MNPYSTACGEVAVVAKDAEGFGFVWCGFAGSFQDGLEIFEKLYPTAQPVAIGWQSGGCVVERLVEVLPPVTPRYYVSGRSFKL
jgi:hypothetical protein